MPFLLLSLPGDFESPSCLLPGQPLGRPSPETLAVHGFAKEGLEFNALISSSIFLGKNPQFLCSLEVPALLRCPGRGTSRALYSPHAQSSCLCFEHLCPCLPTRPLSVAGILFSLAASHGHLHTRGLAGTGHAGGWECYPWSYFPGCHQVMF